ncbi:hypothetical protein X801_02835, partial [Opisthorchis viverrini]
MPNLRLDQLNDCYELVALALREPSLTQPAMDDHGIDRCFNKAFLRYESILKQEFDEIPSAQTLVNLEQLHADALTDSLEELERLHTGCDQTLGKIKQHRTELIGQAQKAYETRRRKFAKAGLREEHKGMSEQRKLAVIRAQPLR